MNSKDEKSGLTADVFRGSDRKDPSIDISALDPRLFFKQVIENLQEVFWIGSADMSEMYFVSSAYERIWGKSCQSLYDNPLSFADAIVSEDRDAVIASIESEVREKGTFDMEYRITGRSGEIKHIWARAFPLRDEKGRLYACYGLAQDITEQKRKDELLSATSAYWQIFEAANDCIFVHDVDTGAVIDVNQKTCEQFGYNKQEIRDGGVELVSSGAGPYRQDRADAWMKKALQEGPQLFEWHCRKKNGALFWTEVNLKLAEIDGQKRLLAIVRDITERKKAEEAAQALELERQDREQAMEESRLKSIFLASISHELRTPLSAIMGFNELLQTTGLTEHQQELVDYVNESSTALLTLVDDLLDLSKIEAGRAKLRSTKFSISDSVKNVARLMKPSAKEKGLSLSAGCREDVPAFVMGDPDRLHQILVNLLSNSIKFTEEGTVSVKVSLKSVEETKTTIRFEVRDTGIGISETDRSRLFRPFSQVDGSDTRKYGGTGLGLSISKGYVELMGGEIGYESKKDSGSTFWFELPYKNASSEAEVSPKSRPSRKRPLERLSGDLRVLVVEDNAVLRKLVLKLLARLGVEAIPAGDGQEAVNAARKTSYDVILMDCQMPSMDGYAATRVIRHDEEEKGQHAQIIAMTASAMAGDRERCLAAGMDGYISKPFGLDELRETLQRHLPKRKPPR